MKALLRFFRLPLMAIGIIIRETPTTFVLENGNKIRKGRRYPIGEHGYGSPCYYSTNEPAGKRILDKFIRDGKIRKLSNCNWKNLSDEKIDSILKIIEAHKEDN